MAMYSEATTEIIAALNIHWIPLALTLHKQQLRDNGESEVLQLHSLHSSKNSSLHLQSLSHCIIPVSSWFLLLSLSFYF